MKTYECNNCKDTGLYISCCNPHRCTHCDAYELNNRPKINTVKKPINELTYIQDHCADVQMIELNGVIVCSEYSVFDQYATIQTVLRLLDIPFKAKQEERIWDNNTCGWKP